MSKFDTVDKLYDWYSQEECQKADAPEIQKFIEEYEQTAKCVVSGDLEIKLWESVCSYGESRERKGFRDGFRLAFRLIQEMQA